MRSPSVVCAITICLSALAFAVSAASRTTAIVTGITPGPYQSQPLSTVPGAATLRIWENTSFTPSPASTAIDFAIDDARLSQQLTTYQWNPSNADFAGFSGQNEVYDAFYSNPDGQPIQTQMVSLAPMELALPFEELCRVNAAMEAASISPRSRSLISQVHRSSTSMPFQPSRPAHPTTSLTPKTMR